MFWNGDYGIIGEKAKLPDANVIMYVLEDGSKIIVRPSGTEPKIKLCILARGTSGEGRGSPEDKRKVNEFFILTKNELTSRAHEIAGM